MLAAWGLYANSGNYAVAKRALPVDSRFTSTRATWVSFAMDTGFIDDEGPYFDFALLDDLDQEVFKFIFYGGTNNWEICTNDNNNLVCVPTSIPFSSNTYFFYISLTPIAHGAWRYVMLVTNAGGSIIGGFNGTVRANSYVKSIQFVNFNAGAYNDSDFFITGMKICTYILGFCSTSNLAQNGDFSYNTLNSWTAFGN